MNLMPHSCTPKMKATDSCVTVAPSCQTAQNIGMDNITDSHCHENLKPIYWNYKYVCRKGGGRNIYHITRNLTNVTAQLVRHIIMTIPSLKIYFHDDQLL